MAEAEKPLSKPTRLQLKAAENKTKLENRRRRSPNGTPITYKQPKDDSETTQDNLERKSRSLTDPDIFGRLKIEGADGLFSNMNEASTFKVETNLSSFKSTDTTMERPLFISSQTVGSKQSVSSLKTNFETGSECMDAAHTIHMAEFTNPLHKGNRQRFRESGRGGSLKAVKPPIAPKPPSPAKTLSSPGKKTTPPVGLKPAVPKKPESPLKKKTDIIESENVTKEKTTEYEEIPSTQPESQEHCSSDEDDGLYSKVVHNDKPIPMHPPPRRPNIPNMVDVCKEPDENSVIQQENEKEGESEKVSEVPIYAKVNKPKSKALENTVGNDGPAAVIRTTRSGSDPTPKNASVVVHKIHEEVSAIREEVMDGCQSDNMKDNDSDFDDDDEPPWDPDDFDDDSDFDENTENRSSRSLSEDGQEGNMVFPDEKSKKLYNIAKEILTTERAYVRRLHLLDQADSTVLLHAKLVRRQDVFYFRLQNECLAHGHIPPEVMQDVFSNISAIHKLHKDFLLPKLEERMSEWSTNNVIGDILKTLSPFLKLYTAYIANFDKSSETLATWTKKSPKFAAIIEDIQKSSECENLTLGHHMLEPIQRVPRYKLLLRDYLSKLPEDSPDYKNCQDAMEIISAAAAHANDSMKKMERFKKLLELQDRLLEDNDLITASRQFIKEGDLVKVAARSAAGHQERTLLLFNDLLLCCAKVPGTNKLKVKVEMDLDGMETGDADEDVELSNTFRVTSKQKVIDFSASSEDDRDTWIKVLKETIEELIRKRQSYKRGIQSQPISECDLGKKAPAWVRDEAVTMCMLCDTMFTITRRRHHCRACGGIFCNTCCHVKAALEYTGGKQNRVCQTCYKIIVRGAKQSVIKKKNEEKKTLDTRKIDSQTKVLLSGFLNYKGGSEKNWVKRWCVLSDNFVLYCYKAKKDTKAAFSIPLPGYVVDKPNRLADDIDKKNAFKVHHKNVVIHYFAADNGEILERWMHNLSFAVKAERIPEEKEEEEAPANEERRASAP